jgi:hypothetical protein
MTMAKTGTPLSWKTFTKPAFVHYPPSDVLIRQYVSPPLPAISTFIGGVSGMARAYKESSNLASHVVPRIYHADSETVEDLQDLWYSASNYYPRDNMGDLYLGHLSTAYPNYPASIIRLYDDWVRVNYVNYWQPISFQSGDRLVIELGCSTTAPNAEQVGYIEFGDPATTDMAWNAAGCPWIDMVDGYSPTGDEGGARYNKPMRPTRRPSAMQAPGYTPSEASSRPNTFRPNSRRLNT